MAYDVLNPQTPRAVFIGNGTRGPFDFVDADGNPIRIRDQTHLVVRRYTSVTDEVGTGLTLNVDFTVNNTDVDAVQITLATAQDVLASTERMVASRLQTVEDVLSLTNGGDFSGPNVSAAISILVEELQELRRDADRSVKVDWRDTGQRALQLAPTSGSVPLGRNSAGAIVNLAAVDLGADTVVEESWLDPLSAPLGANWRDRFGAKSDVPISLNQFSGYANGSDWTDAITRWINASQDEGRELSYSPGTYYTDAQAFANFTKPVQINGPGREIGIFRNAGLAGDFATGDATIFLFNTCARVRFREVGLSGNGLLTDADNTGPVGFIQTPFEMRQILLTGGMRIGIGGTGCNDYLFEDCDIRRQGGVAENSYQNEAILMSDGGGLYPTARGRIHRLKLSGWGTDFDGSDLYIKDVYADTWGYGAALSMNVGMSNVFVDGFRLQNGTGQDVNLDYAGGVECWADNASFRNGWCSNNAGTGFFFGGVDSLAEKVYVRNSGAGQSYHASGFGLGAQTLSAIAHRAHFIDCKSEDTGPGTQYYGYAEPDVCSVSGDSAAFQDLMFERTDFRGVNTNYRFTTNAVRRRWGGALVYSATVNPALVPAGSADFGVTAITASGAAVGDVVQVTYGGTLGGLILTGEVNASNAVTVSALNPTNADIDLASATIRIRVIPQSP